MEDLFVKFEPTLVRDCFRISKEEDELVGFPRLKYGKERFKISNREHITNIYGLSDPRRPCYIRYIGKANCLKSRRKSHIKNALKSDENGCFVDTTHRAHWIRKLLKEGVEPEIVLIAWISRLEWKEIETYYISLFQNNGYCLTNDSPGGQGGYVSPEARKKVSMKIKLFHKNNPGIFAGENNSMWGYVWSKEQRENMSKKNKGRKHTEEQKKKNKWKWINNGIKVTKIKINEPIPEGWFRGQGTVVDRRGAKHPQFKNKGFSKHI